MGKVPWMKGVSKRWWKLRFRHEGRFLVVASKIGDEDKDCWVEALVRRVDLGGEVVLVVWETIERLVQVLRKRGGGIFHSYDRYDVESVGRGLLRFYGRGCDEFTYAWGVDLERLLSGLVKLCDYATCIEFTEEGEKRLTRRELEKTVVEMLGWRPVGLDD